MSLVFLFCLFFVAVAGVSSDKEIIELLFLKYEEERDGLIFRVSKAKLYRILTVVSIAVFTISYLIQ